jgi:hypothetical protein
MELYKLRPTRGDKLRIIGNTTIPPAAPLVGNGDEILFGNLDGMYANCTRVSDGQRVYVAAWTEVEVVDE